MPIYEYKCSECNKIFELLVRSSDNIAEIVCPVCGSKSVKKVMSSYAAFNSSSESFDYNDSGSSCPSCGCDGGSCGI